MFSRRFVLIGVAVASVATLAPRARADDASDFIGKWDPDQDKTLDLAEANKAADAAFDTLDVDHDGTLTRKELGNRVTASEFKAFDQDHDGTLDKAEYEALVAKRFKVANRDRDTTIDSAELKTTAGRHLLRLLR